MGFLQVMSVYRSLSDKESPLHDSSCEMDQSWTSTCSWGALIHLISWKVLAVVFIERGTCTDKHSELRSCCSLYVTTMKTGLTRGHRFRVYCLWKPCLGIKKKGQKAKQTWKRREQTGCKFYMKFWVLSKKKIWAKAFFFFLLTSHFTMRSVWKERKCCSTRALLTQTQGELPRLWVFDYLSKLCHNHYNFLDSLVIPHIFQGTIMVCQSKLQWNNVNEHSNKFCLCWTETFSSTRWQLLLCSPDHLTL